MPKAFLIDTSKCTACRGCQMACKEWKDLPATQTKQRGTHQNPEDLSASTLKLVRFNEYISEGKVVWNFFSDQCRHCVEAPCKYVADEALPGAVTRDEATGAIIYTEKTKKLTAKVFEDMRSNCPYNIPRRDEKTGLLMKCNMCLDRVSNGMLPMCAKTCPTNAITFGDREQILALAEKRLAELLKKYPKAQLLNKDSVSVVYLITDEPKLYHEYALAPEKRVEHAARYGSDSDRHQKGG
ncbi:MAG: formate dehydrogenase [bacterium]|nr:formate dehydrogenase [bacterium]